QAGDPPRKIHWRSWAKTGRPIVIEHEEDWFPHYGLVLDTCFEGADSQIFEEAVSVAASFVSTIESRTCLLDLIFIGGQAQIVRAEPSQSHASHLLEILAAVHPSQPGSHQALEQLVLRHADEFQGL